MPSENVLLQNCPVANTCSPAKAGDCVSYCPANCKSSELTCPASIDSATNCPVSADTCLPLKDASGCPNYCPVTCPANQVPCPATYGADSCPNQVTCADSLDKCPKSAFDMNGCANVDPPMFNPATEMQCPSSLDEQVDCQ